jgi:hypothetical protein
VTAPPEKKEGLAIRSLSATGGAKTNDLAKGRSTSR